MRKVLGLILGLIFEVSELNWELEAYSASRCVRVLSGMLRETCVLGPELCGECRQMDRATCREPTKGGREGRGRLGGPAEQKKEDWS